MGKKIFRRRMSHRLTASGQLERNSYCKQFCEIESSRFLREITHEDFRYYQDRRENYSVLIVRYFEKY